MNRLAILLALLIASPAAAAELRPVEVDPMPDTETRLELVEEDGLPGVAYQVTACYRQNAHASIQSSQEVGITDLAGAVTWVPERPGVVVLAWEKAPWAAPAAPPVEPLADDDDSAVGDNDSVVSEDDDSANEGVNDSVVSDDDDSAAPAPLEPDASADDDDSATAAAAAPAAPEKPICERTGDVGSKNISVVHDGFPPLAVLIALFAGLLLLGGSVTFFLQMMREQKEPAGREMPST